MTKDDIIRLAREAGFENIAEADHWHHYFARFATLAYVSGAEAEREACAKVCDAYGMPDGTSETARILAKAIRARGNK